MYIKLKHVHIFTSFSHNLHFSTVAFTLPKLDLMLEGDHTATITLKLQIKQQVLHLNMRIHSFTLSNINADGWR